MQIQNMTQSKVMTVIGLYDTCNIQSAVFAMLLPPQASMGGTSERDVVWTSSGRVPITCSKSKTSAMHISTSASTLPWVINKIHKYVIILQPATKQAENNTCQWMYSVTSNDNNSPPIKDCMCLNKFLQVSHGTKHNLSANEIKCAYSNLKTELEAEDSVFLWLQTSCTRWPA